MPALHDILLDIKDEEGQPAFPGRRGVGFKEPPRLKGVEFYTRPGGSGT